MTKEETSPPKHIGFIMDGNRRWAKKNSLTVIDGHRAGLKTLENIIEIAANKGLKYLTFYAFSTENWGRKKTEVENLMLLMTMAIKEKGSVLFEKGAKVKIIGRKKDLSTKLQKEITDLEDLTKNNSRVNLAIAISYGGRQEVVDAVNCLLQKGKKRITEKEISSCLYASGYPEPELIVRTGGARRLSGFLLWQAAYSELYFTDALWPDFNEKELNKALDFYQETQRNFGR